MRQRIQLTGTNRSIGLIVLIFHVHATTDRERKTNTTMLASNSVLRWSGGFCEEPEPDPIPNSAVKLLRADGTKSQDLGE